MKRVHFSDKYLINPQHPITVNVVGAGGTGSQVMTSLARIDVTLRGLNHPGLFVTLYDPDNVEASNIGRQLFNDADMGMNKAVCLVTRINHFFGNNWRAVPELYPTSKVAKENLANITITCTDNIKSRIDMWSTLKNHRNLNYTDHNTPIYWMDFGNTQTSGQVVIGSVREKVEQPNSKLFTTVASLKVVVELFDYQSVKDNDSGPSCSLAEALEWQDLFINSTLAHMGCDIIWKMFREGRIDQQGIYLNLDTMKMNPINI